MIDPTVFKAYDVRGIYPQQITVETSAAIGTACARVFDTGEIIVAHDTRYGSAELAESLKQSILKTATALNKKTTVRMVGLSTTPMFYFLVNHFNAVGGCMVTASHNPKNYNGIKTVRAGAEMVSGTELYSWINQNA